MPTVPTEQNRAGIAGVTDAKLQPGDYTGTGLQALGAGMRQLGGTGATIAGEMRQRQDRDDELEVKKAWNAYAEGARAIRADALGRFEADPRGMLDSLTRDYGGLRDWIRSGLKNDRQRGQFDEVIAERFAYDLSGARSAADQALRRGQDEQGLRIEQNAADDAVDTWDDQALFDKHLETGVESLVARGQARGDDSATIEHSAAAYRSGVQRRAVQDMIERDPVAAANRYRLMRDGMTPADRQATDAMMIEPLARALASAEVDKRLLPDKRGGALSPERQAMIASEIEDGPIADALKRYALDDLDDRSSLQARASKKAADTAREAGLAVVGQLGSDFTSISQIPVAVRRDLDEETDEALRGLARANLDPTPVTSGGGTSLMMNIMASENPAAFAKQDMRLIRAKVTPEEYERLARIRNAAGGTPRAINGRPYRRIWDRLQIGVASADGDDLGTQIGDPRLVRISQDETSATQGIADRKGAGEADRHLAPAVTVPERSRNGAPGRHRGSRNQPRDSGLRPSRGRDPATEPTAIPPDRRIRRIFRGIPRGSVTLQAPDGATFLAPANADFKAAYRSAAGHWNSWTAKAPIKAAVGHWALMIFSAEATSSFRATLTRPIMRLES